MWVSAAVVKDLWWAFLSISCLLYPWSCHLTSVVSGHCNSLLIALKMLEAGAGIWLMEDDVILSCDYKVHPHNPGPF